MGSKESAGGGLYIGGPKSNVGSRRGVKVASEANAVVRIASILAAQAAVLSLPSSLVNHSEAKLPSVWQAKTEVELAVQVIELVQLE